MAILRKSKKKTSEEVQISWLEELPVQPSRLQDLGKELNQIEEPSHLSLYALLKELTPSGWFGKMCPVSYPSTMGEPLVPSSGRWLTAGIVAPGECWTLNTSESPSVAAEFSLSDTLEPDHTIPRAYFLSPRACKGILERASRRGRKLPEALRRALQSAVSQ